MRRCLIIIVCALVSIVGIASQSFSSAAVIMSDRLKNSVAGRIVQRRFEQYIGERYSFSQRFATLGMHNFVYTGKLEKIIIPDGYGREHGGLTISVLAVFSEVKRHNRAAVEAEERFKDHPLSNLPSTVPLAKVADIAGTEFPLLGEHVGLKADNVVKSLLANQVNPERWKAVGANGRVIAKYCQGKDEYCEVLIEEVQAWNESEQEQQTFKLLAPTVIMFKGSELYPVAYAGG